jgi:hypothetical protein
MKLLVVERALQAPPDYFFNTAMDERNDPNASRFHSRHERRRDSAADHRVRADLFEPAGDRLRRCSGNPDLPPSRYLAFDYIKKDKSLGKV